MKICSTWMQIKHSKISQPTRPRRPRRGDHTKTFYQLASLRKVVWGQVTWPLRSPPTPIEPSHLPIAGTHPSTRPLRRVSFYRNANIPTTSRSKREKTYRASWCRRWDWGLVPEDIAPNRAQKSQICVCLHVSLTRFRTSRLEDTC